MVRGLRAPHDSQDSGAGAECEAAMFKTDPSRWALSRRWPPQSPGLKPLVTTFWPLHLL